MFIFFKYSNTEEIVMIRFCDEDNGTSGTGTSFPTFGAALMSHY